MLKTAITIVAFANLGFASEVLEVSSIQNGSSLNTPYPGKEKSNEDSKRETPHWIWVVAVSATVLCLAAATLIGCALRSVKKGGSKKKSEPQPKYQLSKSFFEGNPENINPDLSVDQQIELLPYDTKWEFPFDKLKLGKLLGAGTFGLVFEGKASGIIDGEQETTVAVKKIRSQIEPYRTTGLKALSDELKIMTHVGTHLNIVNLMGACTLNINIDDILVILEHCPYGNVLDYLRKKRSSFINQVDARGNLNPSVGATQITAQLLEYKISRRTFKREDAPTSSMAKVAKNDLPPGQADRKSREKDPLCTRDLLCWSFQIANGMTFLAERNILHGDLAARNILLANNNIVKIADFGLARDLYFYGNSIKKGEEELLPAKWMAIESLSDRIFSIRSDIWSFGIVLWEIFSLGMAPYPEIENKDILLKLRNGYRLSKPEYATQQIYTMMNECWSQKAADRPRFKSLRERLSTQLETPLKVHYRGLDDQHEKLNYSLQNRDYLRMMPPVTFTNVESRLIDLINPENHEKFTQKNFTRINLHPDGLSVKKKSNLHSKSGLQTSCGSKHFIERASQEERQAMLSPATISRTTTYQYQIVSSYDDIQITNVQGSVGLKQITN